MTENGARIWVWYMGLMFVFTAFFGRGWLIGLAFGLVVGIVKVR